jgi:dUTP diphosphatase
MSGSPIAVAIQRLPHGAGLELPMYETEGAAGVDLRAAIDADMVIESGKWVLISAGIAIALPENFEAQIRPRSGLAVKHGVTVLNAPGTIDCDYRGEIKVALINHGSEDFAITPGMRIAQMVIAPVSRAVLTEAEELPLSHRGAGGFGSTGQ